MVDGMTTREDYRVEIRYVDLRLAKLFARKSLDLDKGAEHKLGVVSLSYFIVW